ncbi:MAG: hypothetical protein CSA83_02395 [Actinomycetales bacterium]|nr:MAG: hypothetical protein CSA83_02395 [Actinomycetales bacterium]
MRRAEQHRETFLDLEGTPQKQLTLGEITRENTAEQADKLRSEFGLQPDFVPTDSGNQVFNFWRGIVETQGILVLQTTNISLQDFRGLSLASNQMPVILINGSDSATGKSFTLFHEVAHLANTTSGVCALKENDDQEIIANKFAANFLMPTKAVRQAIDNDLTAKEIAEHLSKIFKVSTLAAGVRLRNLNIISENELAELRASSDKKWKESRQNQNKKSGFVPRWRLRFRDLGTNYIGAVARAIEDNRVDLLDASYLLNARIPVVEQLLDEYYRVGDPR